MSCRSRIVLKLNKNKLQNWKYSILCLLSKHNNFFISTVLSMITTAIDTGILFYDTGMAKLSQSIIAPMYNSPNFGTKLHWDKYNMSKG